MDPCRGIQGEGGWLKDKIREESIRQFYDGFSDQEKKSAEINERHYNATKGPRSY
jgi:hypothetical protein